MRRGHINRVRGSEHPITAYWDLTVCSHSCFHRVLTKSLIGGREGLAVCVNLKVETLVHITCGRLEIVGTDCSRQFSCRGRRSRAASSITQVPPYHEQHVCLCLLLYFFTRSFLLGAAKVFREVVSYRVVHGRSRRYLKNNNLQNANVVDRKDS